MIENPVFRVRSYAKINWRLRILDSRSDGFHNIDSLVQLIALFDEIEIVPCMSPDLVRCNIPIPNDEGSLLIRLMSGLREVCPGMAGRYFSIRIRKAIPLGGGLGGGSSNAAVILQTLNRLLSLGLAPVDLADFAGLLGCDIPFFVSGCPFARIQGRGERVMPLAPAPEHFLVLVFPGFGVSTGWAYREWDRWNRHARPLAPPVGDLETGTGGTSPPVLGDLIWNDFEQVVFRRYPDLVRLKCLLSELGCSHAFMSGSGSTMVGVAETAEEAGVVAKRLQQRGFHAISTSTCLPDRELSDCTEPKGGNPSCQTPLF